MILGWSVDTRRFFKLTFLRNGSSALSTPIERIETEISPKISQDYKMGVKCCQYYSAGPPPWSNLENSLKLQIQLDLDQTWKQFIDRLVACRQRQKFTLTRLDQELAWISPPTHTSGNACFKTFWYGSNQLVYVCTQTHTSGTWSVMC